MGKKLHPEADLQATIVSYLRKCCPGVLVFCSLNGVYLGAGSKTGFYIAKLRKLGLRSGEPDLRLHWAHAEPWFGKGIPPQTPKTLYLELKIRPNKVSPEQAACMADLTNAGFPCEVVYSFEEFEELVKRYGIPTRAKSP